MQKIFIELNRHRKKFENLAYDFNKQECTFNVNDMNVRLSTHHADDISFYLNDEFVRTFSTPDEVIDFFLI